jgi:hypothetical protein
VLSLLVSTGDDRALEDPAAWRTLAMNMIMPPARLHVLELQISQLLHPDVARIARLPHLGALLLNAEVAVHTLPPGAFPRLRELDVTSARLLAYGPSVLEACKLTLRGHTPSLDAFAQQLATRTRLRTLALTAEADWPVFLRALHPLPSLETLRFYSERCFATSISWEPCCVHSPISRPSRAQLFHFSAIASSCSISRAHPLLRRLKTGLVVSMRDLPSVA